MSEPCACCGTAGAVWDAAEGCFLCPASDTDCPARAMDRLMAGLERDPLEGPTYPGHYVTGANLPDPWWVQGDL